MYIYVSTQKNIQKHIHETDDGEFPGGPVDRIQRFHCRGLGSIPGQRTEIPQAKKNPPKTKQTKKPNQLKNGQKGLPWWHSG